jgi:subtilase family serine protease
MHRSSRSVVGALGIALSLGFAHNAFAGRIYVGLRGRDEPALRALLSAQQDPTASEYRRWIGAQEFGRRFGAAPRDLKRVERWLRSGGCRIKRAAGRQQVQCVGGQPGALPSELAPLVDDVIDLDQPVDLQHHLDSSRLQPQSVLPDGAFYFTPREYADFYAFGTLHSAGIDGSGQRIGIVATAGIEVSDVDAFRSLYGLPPLDLEQVGTPGSNISRDDLIEAVLDVTWSGAVAPGAAVTLSISSGTLVDAITSLVQRNDVSVMSLSVDFIPSKKTQPLIRQSLKLFRQAATGGKTILVASGDFGPLAVFKPKPKRGVTSFAQSPFVTAVGGTTPTASSPEDAVGYGSEVVWQDGDMASGGGKSTQPRPKWQKGLKSNRRTVPDVSLAAAAVYPIPFDGGITCCVSGTSAAAPSWAGLIAMLDQQTGTPAGLINPKLYELGNAQAQAGPAVFFDIVEGSNSIMTAKGFPAKPGYDLATGWGTPNVAALFPALQ